MTKKKAAPKNSHSFHVVVVISVILALVVLILFARSAPPPKPYSNNIKTFTDCDTPDYYTTLLQKGFGSSLQIKRVSITDSNIKKGHENLIWKRSLDEPYIAYPMSGGIESQKIAIQSKYLNTSFKALVDNDFSAVGYKSDTLNTNSFDTEYGPYEYGYTKGDALIKVVIRSISDIDGTNYSSIAVYCAGAEPHYNSLYSDLLSSPEVQARLKGAYGSHGLPNMIFSIWSIHKNNIIQTDIGSQDWGGGHSIWWYKDGTKWIQLYKGQVQPLCSMLEKYGAEPGVPCLGTSLHQEVTH